MRKITFFRFDIGSAAAYKGQDGKTYLSIGLSWSSHKYAPIMVRKKWECDWKNKNYLYIYRNTKKIVARLGYA